MLDHFRNANKGIALHSESGLARIGIRTAGELDETKSDCRKLYGIVLPPQDLQLLLH